MRTTSRMKVKIKIFTNPVNWNLLQLVIANKVVRMTGKSVNFLKDYWSNFKKGVSMGSTEIIK